MSDYFEYRPVTRLGSDITFDYIKYDDVSQTQQAKIKDLCMQLNEALEDVVAGLRIRGEHLYKRLDRDFAYEELREAKKHLKITYAFAGRFIRNVQMMRTEDKCERQEERNDE